MILIKRKFSVVFGTIMVSAILATVLPSCKKSKSDVGRLVFQETKNKIFKNIESDVLGEKIKDALPKFQKLNKNPKFLASVYEGNEFEPVLLLNQLKDNHLKDAIALLSDATAHGLDTSTMKVGKLKSLINELYDKNSVKSTDEAYAILVELELTAANALTFYNNAIQYGVVSPRKVFAHYYTATKRPDSASFLQPFKTKNIKALFDSIQPKNKAYIQMQQALKENVAVAGKNAAETQKILKVNLERLRWKNLPTEDKYVFVNIADFSLDVMENKRSILHMKVCVGEGREKLASDNLVEYDENDLKKDRPFNRETPQLKSLIHSVQVNPVWNIPQSIASNEIVKSAAADPYYLSSHNIDVFLDGKIIEDTETIDWSVGDPGKKYFFKQRPGDDNSLGKIKFLFNNESSVYLHDTPSKQAFNLKNRAVSHGCVRVEQPLALAEALFGPGKKYDRIKTEMASNDPVAENLSLPKKIPVYLSYFTCWLDESGTLQFRDDVYELDLVLYTYLQKLG